MGDLKEQQPYMSIKKQINNLQEMLDVNLNEIQKLKEVIKPILNQRHKIYAHYDKTVADDPSDFYKKFPIKSIEFEEILLVHINICNDLCMKINNYTVYPFMTKSNDLLHLWNK